MTGHSEEKMRVVGIRKGPGRCECIRDDPRAQCRGSGRCECIRDDSWVHASEHEGVAVPHFKTFMPPAREYLTQYSAVRWECS